MHRSTLRALAAALAGRASRTVATAGLLLLSLVGVQTLAAPAASALGTGRACIFFAPAGARGLGHVGWAVRVDQQDLWIFGSTEDTSQSLIAPSLGQAGYFYDDNQAWSATSSWHEVLATFQGTQAPSAASADSGLTTIPHAANYFESYICEDVPNSAVTAAKNYIATIPTLGYGIATNNCEDHAYGVLQAYNAPNLIAPPLEVFPKDWYASTYEQSGTGWDAAPTPLPDCDRQNCDDRDPIQVFCDNRYRTVTSASWPTGTVELRWSDDCWTNWTRFTPAANQDGVAVQIWVERESSNNDGGIGPKIGGHYGFTIQSGVGPYWSNMLYSPGPARACFSVGGPAHCTAWV
jgi:hypothetical protein